MNGRLDFQALVTDIKNYAYPLVSESMEVTEELATNIFFKPWAIIIKDKLEHESCGQFSLRYYELIHNFCTYQSNKIAENSKKKKVAKLVSFTITTRVVVDKNEMSECEEEDAIAKALEKICANPQSYLIQDNLDCCMDDKECPFGTLNEDFTNK